MDLFDIVSVNVRGINSDEKRLKLYEWLRDINVNIAFLQETHYIEKNEVKYNSRWFGKSYHCYSESQFSKGVSILFKKDLNVDILEKHTSIDGRRLFLKVKIDDDIFSLVNVYAPNNIKERCTFYAKLHKFLNNKISEENVIICGDFNCKIDNTADKSSRKLKEILTSLELFDSWKNKHPDLNGYTWCNANDIPYSRIDYVFISKNFIYDIEKISIRKIPGQVAQKRLSDHRLLKIQFKTSHNERGRGYWKLNNSHINNSEYKMGIQNLIIEIKNDTSKKPEDK